MKKVIIILVSFLISFTTASAGKKQGPDPVKNSDSLTKIIAKLVKDIKNLKGDMSQVKKTLNGKITAVQVNLDSYVSINNEAVENLKTNLDNTEAGLKKDLRATNDSLSKAKKGINKQLASLKEDTKDNQGGISLLKWIGGVGGFIILCLLMWLIFRKPRNLQ